MADIVEAWNSARAAAPPGWRLEGLRCTSTGLAPDQRGDRWLAEACGPDGACIIVEESEPRRALRTLAERLRSHVAMSEPPDRAQE